MTGNVGGDNPHVATSVGGATVGLVRIGECGRLAPYVEQFYRSHPPTMGAPHYVYNGRT